MRYLSGDQLNSVIGEDNIAKLQAYQAILRYIKNDHWYRDVDVETGRPSRNWVDTFQAFFPSLMVRSKTEDLFKKIHLII